MPVIDVRDLRKDYGAVRAVDGLSFHVDAGEVYALLGENGAGKSTAVEILEGHRSATSGSVEVLGADPSSAGRDFRDRIGIVLQSSGVEAEFTVREVIALYGGCYRSPRPLDEVVALVGLDEKIDERVGVAVGRTTSPGRPRTGHHRSARGAVPRRTDDRVRSVGSSAVVGPHRGARRRRHDRAADDALPRRGRAPR